ncbi:hypothetical protein NDU88_006220 [Pleurodeles waltl]|uniref:Uncharacterized protein n=1 Tax=Pleurodeles waltl TaxID=8319 RepID=A0AAV7UKC5_PLEWA|nr:hypothetical protein NDU88_006220 [Pleurodeles waltl]
MEYFSGCTGEVRHLWCPGGPNQHLLGCDHCPNPGWEGSRVESQPEPPEDSLWAGLRQRRRAEVGEALEDTRAASSGRSFVWLSAGLSIKRESHSWGLASESTVFPQEEEKAATVSSCAAVGGYRRI